MYIVAEDLFCIRLFSADEIKPTILHHKRCTDNQRTQTYVFLCDCLICFNGNLSCLCFRLVTPNNISWNPWQLDLNLQCHSIHPFDSFCPQKLTFSKNKFTNYKLSGVTAYHYVVASGYFWSLGWLSGVVFFCIFIINEWLWHRTLAASPMLASSSSRDESGI